VSLRFNHLALRVRTDDGSCYGADFPFEIGLNIIRADNSQGKTNCINAMLYALGLERILTNRKAPPLKPVMTSMIEDETTEKQLNVVDSFVELEVENQEGKILSIKRQVVGELSTDLIETWDGPKLTQPDGKFKKKDFIGFIKGTAKRDFGFQKYLASFLGWNIPDVAKFEGGTGILYLETIIPLAFVEQQTGWSVFPARVPTIFGIRDVQKRGVEFTLGLDTFDMEKKREVVAQSMETLNLQWTRLTNRFQDFLKDLNGKLVNFPDDIKDQFDDDSEPTIMLPNEDQEIDLDAKLEMLRRKFSVISSSPVRNAEEKSAKAEQELHTTYAVIADRQSAFESVQQELTLEENRIQSIKERLNIIEEDLQKNRDAKKLMDSGSKIGRKVSPELCPTCFQKWPTTLVFDENSNIAMTLDENIAYIDSQKDMFQRMKEQSRGARREKKRRITAIEEDMANLRSQVRAIKETLQSRQKAPSVVDIRQGIMLESEIRKLEKVQVRLQEFLLKIEPIHKEYHHQLSLKKKLPWGLTKNDYKKLKEWEKRIRSQLERYGVKSFTPSDIDISKQSYRPEWEGSELVNEASASDLIRLKWAYQLGLLETSTEFSSSQHPQFLILDEPGQQSVNPVSIQELLERAGKAKKRGQQVVIMTSEDETSIKSMINIKEDNFLSIDGRILKRLPLS
jgi:hypothetical protein